MLSMLKTIMLLVITSVLTNYIIAQPSTNLPIKSKVQISKLLEERQQYILVEDNKGRKKLIIKKTGKGLKFSERNLMRYHDDTYPSSLIIIQKEDTIFSKNKNQTSWKQNTYIYSRKTGKPLIKQVSHSIEIGDFDNKVFFVKRDTPNIPKSPELNYLCEDTLRFYDEDWFMYDSTGHLLNKTPFRFAIDFKNGLGVGMQGNKMGIWRSNGTTLIEPRYDKIWRHNSEGFYYIFDSSNLKKITTILNSQGKQILSAQYDDISVFCGKYAFCTIDNKIGLIDTMGNEVIKPIDLKIYKGNLVDSFMQGVTTENYSELQRYYTHEGVAHFFQYYEDKIPNDTITIPIALRSSINNLMLETYKDNIMINKMPHRINRTYYRLRNYEIPTSVYCYPVDEFIWRFNYRSYYDIQANEHNISFMCSGTKAYTTIFVNYLQDKNSCKLLNNDTFFKITKDNKIDFYNLVTAKIKKLKDLNIDIDCNNIDSIVEQAKTQFLLTQQGVRMYFKNEVSYTGYSPKPIVCTWNELKNYIKN